MGINNQKVINAWCMYDWANSVYSLVITSTIFPVYYNSVTKTGIGNDLVSFFGWQVPNTVLYSYSLSFSFLLIAILSPPLSGIADYGGKRKSFMKFFTYIGGASCILLYFFKGVHVEYGIILSILASTGYSGGLVFYNSYLPVIASEDKYDIVSAKGFSLGYIGGVILLLINLVMISKPDWFGFTDPSAPARVSFLMVGVWWIAFAQIPFHYLPRNQGQKRGDRSIIIKGYQELNKVLKSLKELPVLKRFLVSFFFYNTGVQTVMYLSATFGDKALNLDGDKLILTVLIIQLVAIAGSYIFAGISKRRGNKHALIIMVFIWILICLAAYFIRTEYHFYALAFVVGLVMGGIQAISRSTYSKLIPVNTIDHTSYFSFYDVTEKVSIVVGTFSYGFIEQITGNMRNSALSLVLFFLVGLGFLLLIRIPMPVSGKAGAKASR